MMVLIKRRRRRRRRRRKGSDPRGGGGGADTILLPEAMRAEKSSGRAPAEQLCSSSVTDCAKKRLPMSDLTFTLQCRESSWRKGECWEGRQMWQRGRRIVYVVVGRGLREWMDGEEVSSARARAPRRTQFPRLLYLTNCRIAQSIKLSLMNLI